MCLNPYEIWGYVHDSEDESSILLRNDDIYFKVHTGLQLKRPTWTYLIVVSNYFTHL
jgi:hypothetical protein